MKHFRTALALAAALPLAGCITPENDRTTIGRSVRLEALSPAPGRPAGPDLAVPVGTQVVQEPSITGLDRAHWQPTRLQVPVDGTAHRPTYAKRVHFADRTARQRGEYPNAETALQLTGGSLGDQQLEALANPAMAALDTLLLIPRIIWSPPWRVRWSPDVAYERTWAALEARTPLEIEALDPILDDPFAAPPPHPVTP
jgi:hypothetical protein